MRQMIPTSLVKRLQELGVRTIDNIEIKVGTIYKRYLQLAKLKLVEALYTLWITEDAIKRAEEKGVWVVKSLKELTPIKITEM